MILPILPSKKSLSNVLVLLLFAPMFLFSGCKKIENLATVNPAASTKFTIPGAVPGTISFVTPDNDNPNTGKAWLVSKANLDKVTLTVENPSGQTFQFIKSIRFFLQAEGLAEVEVANRFDIENSVGSSMELNATGVDLKEYLKKEKFRLRVEVVTDEVVIQSVQVKADLLFKVVILV
ncbi:MAG: hypothetical protein V4714_17855 [Bacteroidota bacterium]